MKKIKTCVFLFVILWGVNQSFACSIVYYVDGKTGKVFFVNNEDYWYDVKPYIQVVPSTKKEYGRIWYGWNNFGQGGINEKGLVMDGAVTPEQNIPAGYSDHTNGNLTDELLAQCGTIEEAILFLEAKKIALKNAHVFLGDNHGKAVVVEWVNGVKNIVNVKNNRLVATNFNLSDTSRREPTCWRYAEINKGLDALETNEIKDTIDLRTVGNVLGKAVQIPQKDSKGKVGGTLYTTFIDLTEMKFIMIYKLDNRKIHTLDVLTTLGTGKKRKIILE